VHDLGGVDPLDALPPSLVTNAPEPFRGSPAAPAPRTDSTFRLIPTAWPRRVVTDRLAETARHDADATTLFHVSLPAVGFILVARLVARVRSADGASVGDPTTSTLAGYRRGKVPFIDRVLPTTGVKKNGRTSD